MGGQGSLTHFPHGAASFGIPLVGSSDYTTTGNVFFVDSGSTTGADNAAKGSSPDTPFLTIDFAMGRCTANNGDIVFVMPGHAETIASATSLVMDVAGVRVIGMGIGRTRPVLTYSATDSSVEMDAASCSLENIVFVAGISAVVVGINVDAADCSIINCEFDISTTLFDFITAVDIDAVDRASVLNCRFIAEVGTTGMAEAIRLDTANECQIIGNQFTGDITDGCIVLEGAASNSVEIRDNRMWNGHANNRGIVNSVISNGIVKDNSQSYEELFVHANQIKTTTSGSTLNWQVTKHVCSAYTGGSANQHGNDGGTNDPYTMFTVTGDVIVKAIWGVCDTTLTGATATISVGVVGNVAALVPIDTATDILDGNIYVGATAFVGAAEVGNSGLFAINDGLDIIETTATSDVTAGQMTYYCIWAPAEDGASITSADAVI